MKKRLKHLGMVIFSIISIAMLSSCIEEDDNMMGRDISGIFEKSWSVDLGEGDYWSNYISVFTFTSRHSSTSHVGTGIEERYENRGRRVDYCEFDWYLRNGNLYLDYADGLSIEFYNIYTYRNSFSATIYDNRSRHSYRLTFYYEGGYSNNYKPINGITTNCIETE
ncbi:MAG: hypothetical protein KBT27_00865 [Prevotellaceae bacterium]|nr:hypothetical protein [Candidatus Faecinaster equi]